MIKKLLITVIVLEAIISGLALAFIFYTFWYAPLGPSLPVPIPTVGTGELATDVPVSEQAVPALTPEITPTPETLLDKITSFLNPPTATSSALCGGPPVMNLLVVGSDERKNAYDYGLADSIRIVRIDFNTPSVMALDIPRDLWVNIPDIADHKGINQGKLNQAYFYGNPGMGYYDGTGEGPGLLAKTLDLNFGVQVDHYFAMNMGTFRRFIDEIGGIDIYVNSKIDLNDGQDGANPDYVFEPGAHHLDGEMALKLAINRYPTIFQRARYQNIVLSALQEKLLSPGMIPLLPQLVSQFSKSIQTDLSPSDFTKLVCIGKSLTRENMRIVAFPDNIFSNGRTYDPYRNVNTYTLTVDYDLLRTYFAHFMSGTWP